MADTEPTRQAVDEMPGTVLLEFGANWCPHCQAIQPGLAELKSVYPGVRHIVVEDGPGLPLDRSFRVKLWPTLVFLRDGQVLKQIVRPGADEMTEAFAEFASPE